MPLSLRRFGRGNRDPISDSAAIEVFYDGECPLCRHEIRMLKFWHDRRQQAGRGRTVLFTDLSAADFNPATVGKTKDDLMAEIHGRLADGQWVTGVDVFRHIYSALGFSALVSVTRWRPLDRLAKAGYHWFARNRLRLTGRTETACREGSCP